MCKTGANTTECRPENELEFNRAEQKTYILRIQQVFGIKDIPGSKLLGLFKLGVQLPRNIFLPAGSLPRDGCGWGFSHSADLPEGQSFQFWMKPLWDHVVRSLQGFTRDDLSLNVGHETSQMQHPASVFQFRLWTLLQSCSNVISSITLHFK